MAWNCRCPSSGRSWTISASKWAALKVESAERILDKADRVQVSVLVVVRDTDGTAVIAIDLAAVGTAAIGLVTVPTGDSSVATIVIIVAKAAAIDAVGKSDVTGTDVIIETTGGTVKTAVEMIGDLPLAPLAIVPRAEDGGTETTETTVTIGTIETAVTTGVIATTGTAEVIRTLAEAEVAESTVGIAVATMVAATTGATAEIAIGAIAVIETGVTAETATIEVIAATGTASAPSRLKTNSARATTRTQSWPQVLT